MLPLVATIHQVDGASRGARPLSRVQRRQLQRAECVRRAVSAMDTLPSVDTSFTGKAEVDVWPSNIHRDKDGSGALALRSGGVNHSVALVREVHNSCPPILSYVKQLVQMRLNALAVQFPAFRDAALLLPSCMTVAGTEDDDDALFSRSSLHHSTASHGSADWLAAWWDVAAEPQRGPVLLEPLHSDAYQSAVSSGLDRFAASRLQVFREAAKHLCKEFRTYRPLLQSIFTEYDRYIDFCNEFVLEERSSLMRVQEAMLAEKRELLVQIANLQKASSELEGRVVAAEEHARVSVAEATEARNALEASIAKVQLVDKIIADAESDKGILAKKLILAEREVRDYQERLKAPEKKIAALQAQLDNKEAFLKDVSRRYERACNALDSVKKQLKEEQELERRQEEERLKARSKSQLAGSTTFAGNSTAVRELRDRLAVVQARCALLESQHATLYAAHLQFPIAREDAAMEGSTSTLDVSQQSSPRSARRPASDAPGFVSGAISPFQTPRVLPGSSTAMSPTVSNVGAASVAAAGRPSGPGSPVGAVESAALHAQLQSMHPDARLPFCMSSIATLQADLEEARKHIQELSSLTASTDKTSAKKHTTSRVDLIAIQSAVSDFNLPPSLLYPLKDPLRRFFLGSEPEHHHILLRSSGRVRNQKFSLMAIKIHVHSFFADAIPSAPGQTRFVDRFLSWMRRKYGEESAVMSFSFYTSLSWFHNDVDAYLFQQLLDDKIPEAMWKIPYGLAAHVREQMEKASFRHGGALIPRSEAVRILSTEFSAWELSRVEDMCDVFPSEDVEWRRLFVSPKGGAVDALLIQKVRKHWLAEHLTFLNEVMDQILEDPQLGGGVVTPFAFVRSLLHVDPAITEERVLACVAELFGVECVEEVAEGTSQGQVPLHDRFTLATEQIAAPEFAEALYRLPLVRSARRQRISGGIFGLKQLAGKAE